MAKRKKSRRTVKEIVDDYIREQRSEAELKKKFKRSVKGRKKKISLLDFLKNVFLGDTSRKELRKELYKGSRGNRKSRTLTTLITDSIDESNQKRQMKSAFKKSVSPARKKLPLNERLTNLKNNLRQDLHNFFFGEVNNFALVNSCIIFITTYLLVFFANDLAIALAAKYFKLKPILYYYYIIYINNTGWYPHAVKRIFMTGPFLTLGIGIGAYIIYLFLKNKNVFIRLFFIWTSLIGFANFLSKLISVPTYKGRLEPTSEMSLGIVSGYLYYSSQFETALAIIGLVLTVPIGLLLAKPFVQTAWSSRVVRGKDDKGRLVFQVGILPFIFGIASVFIINHPGNHRANFITTIAIGFILLWAYMGARAFFEILIHRQKIYEKGKVSIAALAILFCVIFFYRIILAQGIQL